MSQWPLYSIIVPSGRAIEPAQMPIDALSLGRGVFETILCLGGKCVFPERHAARLAASCLALDVADEASSRSLFERAERFAAGHPLDRARLRIAVFGDQGRRRVAGLVALRPADPPGSPVRLTLSRFLRRRESPLSTHKTVDYLENLLARKEAVQAGFDDSLWLDSEGNVAETSVANIFFSIDARLTTPAAGCILPGVVREWAMETARTLGLELSERPTPASELARVEWAFVTNSIIGFLPVSHIGGRELADAGRAEAFRALCSAYDAVLAAATGRAASPETH